MLKSLQCYKLVGAIFKEYCLKAIIVNALLQAKIASLEAYYTGTITSLKLRSQWE